MLQRIQTLFLVLAVLAMAVFLAFPIWQKVSVDTQEQISLSATNLLYQKGALKTNTPVFYLAFAGVLSLIISIFTIFQYKNRLRQMMLVALNSLLTGGLMAGIVYMIFYKTNPQFLPEKQGDFDIGFYAVFASLFMNWIANRFIRRDEKTVKDSDRMR